MIDFKGKWIDFTDITAGTKTKRFMVHNREKKQAIGEVKWYGPFRQYSYFPFPDTVYERQCMLDITRFMHLLMQERKLEKQLLS